MDIALDKVDLRPGHPLSVTDREIGLTIAESAMPKCSACYVSIHCTNTEIENSNAMIRNCTRDNDRFVCRCSVVLAATEYDVKVFTMKSGGYKPNPFDLGLHFTS